MNPIFWLLGAGLLLYVTLSPTAAGSIGNILTASIPYPNAPEFLPNPLPINWTMVDELEDTSANQLVALGYVIPPPGDTVDGRQASFTAQNHASRDFATRHGLPLTGTVEGSRAILLAIEAAYRQHRGL
jgi:hypothetical protein